MRGNHFGCERLRGSGSQAYRILALERAHREVGSSSFMLAVIEVVVQKCGPCFKKEVHYDKKGMQLRAELTRRILDIR